jgi:hypothetical protein
MKKNVVLSLLLGLLMLSSVAQVRASVAPVPVPAITSWSSATSGASEPDDPIWTIGFQFKANKNLSVTALGVYDVHVPTEVGLWMDGDISPLFSTVISGSGYLIDGFRYVDLLNPISLKAGETYLIGANVKSWLSDPIDLVTSSQITYLAGAFADGGSTPEPFETNYITVNFLSVEAPVPLPPSALLFASGLIGLIGRRSKTIA